MSPSVTGICPTSACTRAPSPSTDRIEDRITVAVVTFPTLPLMRYEPLQDRQVFG
jgi:hypothetical protein